MAIESITKTLGSGSGIDIKALVASLVEAQYATKNSQLTAKADTLTAQISGVAKLKSAVTGFDSALKSLVKGGTLATQPTSSDAKVLGVSLLSGGTPPTSPTVLTVDRVASAQAATTAAIDPAKAFAAGYLSVKIAGAATATRITVPANATVTDIAALIKNAGLSTVQIADGDATRLTVKGATGASQAFAITVVDQDGNALSGDARGELAAFATDGGLAVGTTAQDASIRIDGATYTRSSNSITNLVPGVKLDLVAAGTVTVAATRPTLALSQAVSDFVETYNQLQAVVKEQTNSTNGVLKNDSSATGIARALGGLTTTKLSASATGKQTLADVGVATNRDGTLSVDSARLSAALTSDPAGVEALFADGTGASGGGLSAALSAVAARLTSKTFGLDAATTRYTRQQTDVADAKTKAADAATAATTRMTQQFAGMDARVAAYKSTQTFLTNQIAAWNKSDN